MVIWLDLDIIKIKPPKTGLKNADISKNPNIQLSVNFGMDSHRSMDNHTRGGGGTPHMKGVGMLVVSLRGVNFGFLVPLRVFLSKHHYV